MKYDPKMEALVFLAVKELGEATTEEIFDYVTEQEKTEISKTQLMRYLRRWKAKKILALNYHDGQTVWKLADIPPWYSSGIMAICKGTTNDDMNLALEGLDKRLQEQGRIIKPHGVYGQYQTLQLTFKTVDPILGGWVSKEERELIFPRNAKGELFIPMNWLHGWIRDNAALVDLPQSLTHHIAWGNGVFAEQPELLKKCLKVKTGLSTYEAIPEGSEFTVLVRIPLKGTDMKTLENFKEFLDMLAEAPLRGLGAYPRAFGGRVKLIKMT